MLLQADLRVVDHCSVLGISKSYIIVRKRLAERFFFPLIFFSLVLVKIRLKQSMWKEVMEYL